MSWVQSYLTQNTDVEEVKFSIYTTQTSSQYRISVNGTAEYKYLSLTAGWNEITLTRAEALSSNGLFMKGDFTNSSAQTLCFTNMYLLKKSAVIDPVISLLDAIPQTTSEVTMYDGGEIYKAYNAYEALSDTYKAFIDTAKITVLTEVKDYYDTYYIVAFDTSIAWVKKSTSVTYPATSSITLDDTTYASEYGTVTRIEVDQTTGDNYKNFRAQIIMTSMQTLLNENTDIEEVKFSIYTTQTSSQYRLYIDGDTAYNNVSLTAGSWTEITLTREEALNSSGLFAKGDFTNSSAQTLCFTNFYLIKPTS